MAQKLLWTYSERVVSNFGQSSAEVLAERIYAPTQICPLLSWWKVMSTEPWSKSQYFIWWPRQSMYAVNDTHFTNTTKCTKMMEHSVNLCISVSTYPHFENQTQRWVFPQIHCAKLSSRQENSPSIWEIRLHFLSQTCTPLDPTATRNMPWLEHGTWLTAPAHLLNLCLWLIFTKKVLPVALKSSVL